MFLVDWSELACCNPFIEQVANNTQIVAQHMFDFINFVIDETGANLKDFYPVGFSMGSHVVGRLGNLFEGILPRIMGLVPANPTFGDNRPQDQQINPDSAQYVDIFHTGIAFSAIFEPVNDLIT